MVAGLSIQVRIADRQIRPTILVPVVSDVSRTTTIVEIPDVLLVDNGTNTIERSKVNGKV